jgi:hypothetical protein
MISSFTASAYYLTQAEQCSTIDLRTEFLFKMRNQGDVSWCYANAASDYLQYHFKIAEPISAADIAIRYNLRPWPRLLRWLSGGKFAETGFIRSALWDAVDSGYCPEEVFPSEHWIKRDAKGVAQEVQLKEAIEDLFSLQEQIQDGFYLNASELPYTYEFKTVSKEVLYDLLANASAKSLLNELRLTACEKNRKPYPDSIGAIGMRLKGRNTFNRINGLLNIKMPVTVDFFYGFLNNVSSYKRNLSELHTTLLVGRRFQPQSGECQYLIKNSYGPDCSEYDPSHTCEGGYIWVNENALYRAMTSYVYIKDPRFDDSGPDLKPETPAVKPASLNEQQIQGEPGLQSSAVVPE